MEIINAVICGSPQRFSTGLAVAPLAGKSCLCCDQRRHLPFTTGYAAWKIERHTGVRVEVTPMLRRHPVLWGLKVSGSYCGAV